MLEPTSDSRKIFFLYPHSETEKNIIEVVFTNEYETFLIHDHTAARKILTELNKSFIFINIDKLLKNLNWQSYIKEIEQINSIQNVMIGIISRESIDSETCRELTPFIISFENGIESCSQSILKILEENNARGRRKYIRAKCNLYCKASFSIKIKKSIYAGIIHDISTFGMACTFQEDPQLNTDEYIADLQLRLDGLIYKASGKIIAMRKENNICVIMFDYKNNPLLKKNIQKFIFNWLQKALHHRLKELN